MKLTQVIYLVLAIVGFAAVLAIPMSLYGPGSHGSTVLAHGGEPGAALEGPCLSRE